MTFPSMRAGIVTSVLASVVLAADIAAQDSTSRDSRTSRSVSRVHSVLVGGPQRVSIGVGSGQWKSTLPDGHSGDYSIVDLGVGGGKVVIGAASGHIGGLWQARLALLRTWRDPALFEADRTLGGVELHHSIGVLTFGVAHYWRMTGVRGERARALSGTVGVLF